MSRSEPVACPKCDWSGTADELVEERGAGRCPVCDRAVDIPDPE